MQTLRKETLISHDSEDGTYSCEERLTGRHILHSQELEASTQEAPVCVYCLDRELELWQVGRGQQGLRSAILRRCSNEDCDRKQTDLPSSDRNGGFYAINRQSVLGERLYGNGHVHFKWSVQLWICLLLKVSSLFH